MKKKPSEKNNEKRETQQRKKMVGTQDSSTMANAVSDALHSMSVHNYDTIKVDEYWFS